MYAHRSTDRAIETRYKGYRFRSRLEAKWAVYFDALGIEWEYEVEGFELGKLGRYLPDFWLPEFGVYAEVKPTTFTPEQVAKCEALKEACLLLDGPPAHKGWYLTHCDDGEDGWPHYFESEEFGRVMLCWSQHKGRLWYLFGEDAEDYEEPTDALNAARGARFEFGENG
jgi:hypothetical protein